MIILYHFLTTSRQRKSFLKNIEMIRFVGNHDYSLFSYKQDDKKLRYEADLMRFLYNKLSDFDINITYEQKEWRAVKQSAIDKEADVITNMAVTKSRKGYYAFTKPYAEILFAVVQSNGLSPVKKQVI